MAIHPTMDDAFAHGLDGHGANINLRTSGAWEAFEIGRWLRTAELAQGAHRPVLHSNRGSTYTVMVGNRVYRIKVTVRSATDHTVELVS